MPPEKPDIIDMNRRNFIKASLFLAGGFVLGKVLGLFSWPSRIGPATPVISAPTHMPPVRIKEYKNARYGFSLIYPSDLKIATFDEGGGASTTTFQNPEKGEGFQLFIAPYVEPHVGEVPYNGTQENEPRLESSDIRESLTNIA